jgi:hypothetical protein
MIYRILISNTKQQNKMKKLLWTLSVLALVSCGSDDDNGVTPQPEPRRTLTVVVGENPMQDENAQQNGDATARETFTRTAAATTTASLSSFILNYTTEYHQPFVKSGDPWDTAYWPTPGDLDSKLDFYAHDGGSFVWNGGTPYVSFTMDELAFNQKDLLLAKNSVAFNENNGHVPLLFDHACAGVQFKVYQEDDKTYVVKSIKLQNVKNTGKCYFSNYSWEVDEESTAEYTLTNKDANLTITKDLQLLPCQWLFIIPQKKDGLQLEIKYANTVDAVEVKTKTLRLPAGTWEAGKQYTVKIRIGGGKAA